LKEESEAVEGRPEVFLWRGRTLRQPLKGDDGSIMVVEEGTGEVIFKAGGGKTPCGDKLPIHHLQHLLCPPGVTHSIDGKVSAEELPARTRRTRHLYGKEAADWSLWFGGDRIALLSWAPWTWRGGTCAPLHSTSSVREHAASLLPITRNYSMAETWRGVMAFSTDGSPLIGHLPNDRASNVYMLGALGSEGVARALAAGEMLAALLAAAIAVDRDDDTSADAAARKMEIERELGGAVPTAERGVVPMEVWNVSASLC